MKTLIAAVALATVVIASPAFAQSSSGSRRRQPSPHETSPYNAYNAVTPFGSPAKVTNTAREKALRDCSTLAGAFKENTWGSMASQQYRSCMAQHGQAE